MLSNSHHRTFDAELQLKDAGAVTASGAATVGGSAKVLSLLGSIGPTAGMAAGANTGKTCKAIIDVSAITGTNVACNIAIQGSTSPTFASGIVNLAAVEVNTGTAKTGGADVDATAGRYEVGVSNWRDGVQYPYMRAYHTVGGTSPSINYTARLAFN